MSDRIKFTALMGKTHIALSILFLLASLTFLGLRNKELHGATVSFLAIPLLVSGSFLHILPSYNGKAPPKPIALLPTAVLPAFIIDPRLYLLLYLSAMLLVILYSITPFSTAHYYQKLLAVSSFTAALISVVLFDDLEELGLILLYTLAVGMIFAVNTTALTFTYGQKPRGKASIPLSILHTLSPFIYLVDKALFQTTAIVEAILYMYIIRLDSSASWLRRAKGFKERPRKIHTNLILSSLASVALYPLWLPAIHNPRLSIHLLAFGFISLNVAAHGPVLIPLAFRVKTKPPSLLLPSLFVASALTKALATMAKASSIYSCAFFAAAVGLLAYYTVISRES